MNSSTRRALLFVLTLLVAIFTTPVDAVAHGGLESAAPGSRSLPADASVLAVAVRNVGDPAGLSESESFGVESPLYAAVRWLTFAAIVVAVGAVSFRMLVLRILQRAYRRSEKAYSQMIGQASERSASFGFRAALTLGLAALLRLYAQSYAFYGAEGALDAGLIATLLRHTVWGWGWMLQAVGVGIAATGFALARRGRVLGWSVATLGVASLAFTPALSGHAVAVLEYTWLAVLADGMHVIGAGGWLGSLFLVACVGMPAVLRLPEGERGRKAADLIGAFSPTALIFAGMLVVTGAFSAWQQLHSASALWGSDYGRTLLLKLALVAVVAGAGAFNWLRVKPGLGAGHTVGRLRRSTILELTAAALVLVVTAILVATPTAVETMDEDATARTPSPAVGARAGAHAPCCRESPGRGVAG